MLAIPYALEPNDTTTMIGRQVSAAHFSDMVVDEFDELRETAGERPVVISLVLHSCVFGVPFRFRRRRRAPEHLAGFSDSVWLTTPGGIYSAFSELRPPPTRS